MGAIAAEEKIYVDEREQFLNFREDWAEIKRKGEEQHLECVLCGTMLYHGEGEAVIFNREGRIVPCMEHEGRRCFRGPENKPGIEVNEMGTVDWRGVMADISRKASEAGFSPWSSSESLNVDGEAENGTDSGISPSPHR